MNTSTPHKTTRETAWLTASPQGLLPVLARISTVARACQATSVHLLWTISTNTHIPTTVAHNNRIYLSIATHVYNINIYMYFYMETNCAPEYFCCHSDQDQSYVHHDYACYATSSMCVHVSCSYLTSFKWLMQLKNLTWKLKTRLNIHKSVKYLMIWNDSVLGLLCAHCLG